MATFTQARDMNLDLWLAATRLVELWRMGRLGAK